MSEQSLDPSGEARDALRVAVRDYGPEALSNPQVLNNLFKDLLPDSPREASLLVAAAEANVAGTLQEQVRGQMDPDTAVRLSAANFGQRRALDPAACSWATSEFARALGYSVSEPVTPPAAPPVVAPPGPAGAPPPAVAPTPPVTGPPPAPVGAGSAYAGPVPPPYAPPGPPAPGAYPPPGGQGPPVPPSGYGSPPVGAPGPQGSSGWPGSAPPAPTGWQSAGQAPPPGGFSPAPAGSWPPGAGPAKRRNTPVIITVVALVALFGYFVVAAAAHIPPFSKSPSTTIVSPTTAATTSPTTSPRPTTSVGPTTTPTTTTPTTTPVSPLLPIAKLVPDDADSSSCGPQNPVPTVLKGVTGSFRCETIAGMPNGGVVIGYQFDNAADYEASLAAYNADNGFDPAKASSGCPPTGETGLVGWHSDTYPSLHGQQIECLHEGNADKVSVPTYIWTAPTQLAIFKALASPSMNFQQLDDWWTNHSGPSN